MKEFKGKVAVVTGAASGIGWGLAERCADEGMKVVLADIEGPALEKAGEQLKNKGADVLTQICDVSRLDDVESLARKAFSAFGGVHLLFNNAGVQAPRSMNHPVWENTLEDWQWLLGVNLWGVIHGVRTFLPLMLEQKCPGHIVNTSSMAGLIAESRIVVYAVTKAAVIKLSEGLYLQLKARNLPVGVSVLCPAFVHSRLDDAERNRPGPLVNPPEAKAPPKQPGLQDQLRQAKVNILSPEQSAGIVFQAIREEKFYIFTDPLIKRLFKQAADSILLDINPESAHIV